MQILSGKACVCVLGGWEDSSLPCPLKKLYFESCISVMIVKKTKNPSR